jgi:two-component system nitrate/nitrite sensor histidine kinase NarX
MDLDAILTTVLDTALNLQIADGVVLMLCEEASDEVYARSISRSLNLESENLRLTPCKESHIAKVLNSGNAWSTSDYLNDSNVSHDKEMDGFFRANDLGPCLAVPVEMGEHIFGVLMAVYKKKTNLSQRKPELLQQCANQVAVALENIQLRNQIQELAIIEERTRLSREMHDSWGQVLAYLGLTVDEIGLLVTSGHTEKAVLKLDEVSKVVRNASDDVRDLILALRTSTSLEVELPSMLQEYLESFQQQANIEVSLVISREEATRFSPRVALQLGRVIQEALSNVRKHARASQAKVGFEVVGDELVVSIVDNGIGFEVSHVYSRGQQFGIQVMNERMTELGGNLEIDSHPGKGTRILARMPLDVRNEI